MKIAISYLLALSVFISASGFTLEHHYCSEKDEHFFDVNDFFGIECDDDDEPPVSLAEQSETCTQALKPCCAKFADFKSQLEENSNCCNENKVVVKQEIKYVQNNFRSDFSFLQTIISQTFELHLNAVFSNSFLQFFISQAANPPPLLKNSRNILFSIFLI